MHGSFTSKFSKGKRSVFLLYVHLVFVTKYRKKVFKKIHLDALVAIFEGIGGDFEACLRECNGEDDHVHLLVEYPPKVAISKLVTSLKGVSSRLLKKRFPLLAQAYWKGALWSPGYFASSCGGAPLMKIQQYIANQLAPN